MQVLFQALGNATSPVIGPMHGPFNPFFEEAPKPREQDYIAVLQEQTDFLAEGDRATVEFYRPAGDETELQVTHRSMHGAVRQYTFTGSESEVGFIALFYAYWMAIRLGKLPSGYRSQWFEDYGHGGDAPHPNMFMKVTGEFNINRIAKHAFLRAMGVEPVEPYLSVQLGLLVDALPYYSAYPDYGFEQTLRQLMGLA